MKSPRKSLIKKLDSLVSEISKKRNPSCVLCGKTDSIGGGHLFTSKNYSTRWNMDNIWTQCRGCNMTHEYDPWPYYNWYIKKFGIEKLRELYNKWRQKSNFKQADLEKIYKDLAEYLLVC